MFFCSQAAFWPPGTLPWIENKSPTTRIATVRFGSVSVRSVLVRSGSGSFRFRLNSGSDSRFFHRKTIKIKNIKDPTFYNKLIFRSKKKSISKKFQNDPQNTKTQTKKSIFRCKTLVTGIPRFGTVRFGFGRLRFGPVPVRSGSGSRFFLQKSVLPSKNVFFYPGKISLKQIEKQIELTHMFRCFT